MHKGVAANGMAIVLSLFEVWLLLLYHKIKNAIEGVFFILFFLPVVKGVFLALFKGFTRRYFVHTAALTFEFQRNNVFTIYIRFNLSESIFSYDYRPLLTLCLNLNKKKAGYIFLVGKEVTCNRILVAEFKNESGLGWSDCVFRTWALDVHLCFGRRKSKGKVCAGNITYLLASNTWKRNGFVVVVNASFA